MIKLFFIWLCATLISYILICIIKTAYLEWQNKKYIDMTYRKNRKKIQSMKREKAEYYATEIEKLYVNLIFNDIINDMQGGFCHPELQKGQSNENL